jgi:hypothetical protein
MLQRASNSGIGLVQGFERDWLVLKSLALFELAPKIREEVCLSPSYRPGWGRLCRALSRTPLQTASILSC